MPSVGAPSSEPTVATRVVTASPVHASPYSPESTLNSREKSTPAAVFASAVAPPPQLVASAWASRTGAMRDETVDQVGMDDDAASAAGTRNASLVDSRCVDLLPCASPVLRLPLSITHIASDFTP